MAGKEEVAKIAQKFINLEVIALAFLLPLFFLPVTTEFFEFNKLILLAVGVVLGVLAWGIKAVTSGNLGIRRSPFDVPIATLWLVTLISAVLSEHLMTSLAGNYLRWHPSLATVTIFTVFYFLLTTNLERWALKYIGYALLASSAVAGLLFIPQYFGANLFGQEWSSGRTFTLLGSPNTLALFLGVIAPLALREILIREKLWIKLVGFVLTLLLLFTLTLLNSAVGWIALAVSFIVSLSGLDFVEIKKSLPYLLVASASLIIFIVLILVPPVRNHTPFKNGPPQEIGLDLRTSWSVSATSFRQRPLWGSGPGTFLFDFTRYKPLSYNYTPLWSIRFDKPISEYLLAFAEMGLLGVLAYLFLIVTFISAVLKAANKRFLPIAGGIFAAFFLSFSTAVGSFLLLLALASAVQFAEQPSEQEVKPGKQGYLALGLAVLFALFLSLGVYRIFAAEFSHRQAITAFQKQDLQRSYNLELRALSHLSWQDQYHTSLAQISFTWANQLASKQDLTDEERSNIQYLVSQAIAEAKRATDLSPLDVGNWEVLAQTYRNLIGFAQGAEDWAANAYLQAINLDLFNPVLRVNFGGLFYQQQDFERAIEQFRAAVNLKNNFANAHYNLGRAYTETGKTDLAITEIETALRLTPEDTPGYEEAKAILEQLKSQKK